jgi:hypothetical protein
MVAAREKYDQKKKIDIINSDNKAIYDLFG